MHCFIFQVDDKGKIVDAKFKTFGCGSAIASSSLATEWIKGQSLEYAAQIKNQQIAKVILRLPLNSLKIIANILGAISTACEAALFNAGTGRYSGSPQ